MKQILMAISILVLLFGFVLSDDPVRPVLEKGDVSHFVKTYPQLKNDMEAFGLDYDSEESELTIPQGIQSNQELMAILKKHGWDEHFFQKAMVIITGYATVRYDRESVTADSEMEQALKEIESNPDLPASMKQQLKQQIAAAQGAIGQTGQGLKQNIHPADLALVQAQIKQLKQVLDEDEE